GRGGERGAIVHEQLHHGNGDADGATEGDEWDAAQRAGECTGHEPSDGGVQHLCGSDDGEQREPADDGQWVQPRGGSWGVQRKRGDGDVYAEPAVGDQQFVHGECERLRSDGPGGERSERVLEQLLDGNGSGYDRAGGGGDLAAERSDGN